MVKPELLRQWFRPRGFTITEVALEACVGGRYCVVMQPRSGAAETVGGEYREFRVLEGGQRARSRGSHVE